MNAIRFIYNSALFVIILCAMPLSGMAAESADSAAVRWEGLIGEWTSPDNQGADGTADGLAKFFYDLDGKIIIRESFARYPARGDKAAFTHRDRLTIYQLDSDPRAIYFDNEGHVIRYRVEHSDHGNRILFTSEATDGGPRFRMTYRFTGERTMDFMFEIAPPGADSAFRPYITSQLQRK